MTDHAHFVQRCPSCNVVGAQCKCPAANKHVEWQLCERCKSGPAGAAEAAIAEAKSKLVHACCCAKLRVSSAWCTCGALGSVEDQQRAWTLERAKAPFKHWRFNTSEGEQATHKSHPGTFDELVVGHWLHIEVMDERDVFVRVGKQRGILHLAEDGTARIDWGDADA